MQDKKSFGKYIAEKRKEVGLTQEELASKLYVIPTTVSKWERGITYPDITMISDLCKELNISEHEFFIACDDLAMNREKIEAKRYRNIIKSINYFFLISYVIAIITCFICNLVIDHKLSWFFIVLISIMISFCITNLPIYIKKDRFSLIKVAGLVNALTYILLFVVNIYVDGNWFLESCILATFEFLLLWICILICSFISINKYFKISICLIVLAVSTVLTNPVCSKVLNIPNENNDIYNNICAVGFIVIAIIFLIIGNNDNKVKKFSNK